MSEWFPLALLLLLICVAFAFLARSKGWLRLIIGLACACLPAIIVTQYVDVSQAPFGDIRVRIDRVYLNPFADAPPFSFGGQEACDDYVISRLSQAAFVIEEGVVKRKSAGANGANDCAISGDDEAKENIANEADPARSIAALEYPSEGLIPLSRRTAWLSGTALGAGDEFCLFQCQMSGANWYRVKEDGRSLTIAGKGSITLPPLPERALAKPAGIELLKGIVEYSPGQAIFPLRDYGLIRATSFDPFDDPCEQRQLCHPESGKPADSYLFFDKGGSLSVMLLDEGAQMRSGSGDEDAGLELVNQADLQIWEVVYAEVSADFVEEPRASHLRKRFSASVDKIEGRTVLALGASAPVASISQSQIELSRSLSNLDNQPSPVFLGGAPQGPVDSAMSNVLRFEKIGGNLSGSLLGSNTRPIALWFPADFYDRSIDTLPGVAGIDEVPTPRLTQIAFSSTVQDSSPANVRFLLDRLTVPAIFIWTVLAWSAVLVFLTVTRLRRHPNVMIAICAVQTFLAFRAAVAFGSFAMDPTIVPLTRIGEVVVAYVAFPAMLLAIHPRLRWKLIELLPAAIVVGSVGILAWSQNLITFKLQLAVAGAVALLLAAPFILSGIWNFFARGGVQNFLLASRRWIILLGLVLFSAGIIALLFSDWASFVLKICLLCILTIVLSVVVFRKKLSAWVESFDLQNTVNWLIWSVIVAVMRVAIIPLGKEQIFSLRISVIYLPLALICSAGLIVSTKKSGRPIDAILASAGILGMFVVSPLIVSDIGFALIYWLPVLVALAAASFAQFWKYHRLGTAGGIAVGIAWFVAIIAASSTTAMLILLVGLSLALCAALYFFREKFPSVSSKIESKDEKKGFAISRNVSAFLAVAMVLCPIVSFPASMAKALWSETRYELSTSSDENTQLSSEELTQRLDQYADQGVNEWRLDAIFDPAALNQAGVDGAERLRRWRFTLEALTSSSWGHGFPYQANISEVRVNQADDNLSAAHLMAPFGRLAGAAFILLLGCLAAQSVKLGNRKDSLGRTIGSLAIWTFAFAGAYMILANLILVPFTGRNVYFLAAFSFSDLLEGSALIVLSFFGLNRVAARGGAS